MTKYEYIYLLKEKLSIYDGNIDEIIINYETIITEMSDEGLGIDEIIERLGGPDALAAEIVEELELSLANAESYNAPSWLKMVLGISAFFGLMLFALISFIIIVLIVAALITIVSVIFSLLFVLFVAPLTFVGGVIAVPAIPLAIRFLLLLTAISGSITTTIIAYFCSYHLWQLIKKVNQKIIGMIKTWWQRLTTTDQHIREGVIK